MIYLADSQNSWGFSKPRELGGRESALWLGRPSGLSASAWGGPRPARARPHAPPPLPQKVSSSLVLLRGSVHPQAPLLGDPAPGGCPQEVRGTVPGGLGLCGFIFSRVLAVGHSGYICTEGGRARAGAGSLPAPRRNLIAPAWPSAASQGEVRGGG